MYLKEELFRVAPQLPEVEMVDRQNIGDLVRRSEGFRMKVRGKEVGRLG